ncbi:MAG: hypothetical protein M3018_06955 [Actinomycetota bacterium]|nr:hypothetical protein [Actinomycetota bacterium]
MRIVAPTAEGIALFQLWESPEARQRNAENPHHAAAIETSGMRRSVRTTRARAFEEAELKFIAPEAR